MRLVTYKPSDRPEHAGSSAGVVVGDRVLDVGTALGDPSAPLRSVGDVLAADAVSAVRAWAAETSESGSPLAGVQLLPPVARPSKVIGVGMNYRTFVEQLGESPPEHPVLFHKTASALRGHRQSIVVPSNTSQAVPEGELAVVIGRPAARISPDEARDHVAGYACANDVSARNLEFQTSQWTSGKMLPTFCPLGPWMVTPDELDDVSALQVRTLLNGQVIQRGSTAEMIFPVDELISRISMLVDLEIGDVILTGTPSDLGEVVPPVYLAPGDTIEVHVEGVGRLTNSVVADHLKPRDRSPVAIALEM